MITEAIRQDFPILKQYVHGHPWVYLDNAATSQKPQAVIDTLSHYYMHQNANIHRGIYLFSEQATQAYEQVREKVKDFIGAFSSEEIVFVRGTTEAINLVAHSYGTIALKKDDYILMTQMEHHSNIVPWQLLCESIGAKIKAIPITCDGELDLEAYKLLLNNYAPRLVALIHVSNVLGTVNPIAEMIRLAHASGAKVLIDGAQAVGHISVDVQELDCDFYTFSGHKMLGPTGIGVLYAKKELLQSMLPYQAGGNMIRTVSFEKTTWNDIPFKFEAGTPNIADVLGLGTAIDYLEKLGISAITEYEQDLLHYATQILQDIPQLQIIGNAKQKSSIISFIIHSIHPHDIGTILDQEGIAIRAGHHCAMPLMEVLKLPATARASLLFYNTRSEIDYLVQSLRKVCDILL